MLMPGEISQKLLMPGGGGLGGGVGIWVLSQKVLMPGESSQKVLMPGAPPPPGHKAGQTR